mmetsp:Transcript_4019/g.8612  ORF Transcript_4019/g.8612 Transcript_4019/m.8612 type:complete len:123 (+) Transcript_4019:2648-3016(+)
MSMHVLVLRRFPYEIDPTRKDKNVSIAAPSSIAYAVGKMKTADMATLKSNIKVYMQVALLIALYLSKVPRKIDTLLANAVSTLKLAIKLMNLGCCKAKVSQVPWSTDRDIPSANPASRRRMD